MASSNIHRAARLQFSSLALVAAFAAFLALTSPAQAQDTAVSDAERAKIEAVLKDYIAKNPVIVVEALQNYQSQQRADMDKQFVDKFGSKEEEILKAGHPTLGPDTADMTIIEFYDYNCGYCKKAYEDVAKLHENDKNIRFVFIEMPILSPTSIEAAQWALAAADQGKFFEFHSKLMEFSGQKDKKLFEKFATELKMDVKKAAEFAEKKSTLETIEKNLTLARELGISGTPGFILNGQLTPGYMGYEAMKDAVAQIRAQKADAAN